MDRNETNSKKRIVSLFPFPIGPIGPSMTGIPIFRYPPVHPTASAMQTYPVILAFVWPKTQSSHHSLFTDAQRPLFISFKWQGFRHGISSSREPAITKTTVMRREFLTPFDRKRLSDSICKKKYRRRCCNSREIIKNVRSRVLRGGRHLLPHSVLFEKLSWHGDFWLDMAGLFFLWANQRRIRPFAQLCSSAETK